MSPPRDEDWDRLRRAISGESLPLALVDLDALDANVRFLAAAARGKRIRIASKSVRSPSIMRLIATLAGDRVHGVMAYAAAECAFLVEHGFHDIVVGYPTVQASDLAHVAHANRAGANAALVVDCAAHVASAARAARDAGVRIPLLVDVDVSYRPFGDGGVHLGVRRSPIREADDVVRLAARIAEDPALRFDGIMAYEAHIAGLADKGAATRAMKALARPRVARIRTAIVGALSARGLAPRIVNGGGTGSVKENAAEAALTEITVGSGFLAGHLFDHYAGLALRPSAYFALQVVRAPADGIVTCHGGGWIASGSPARDRLPLPALPPGLALLDLEGAGEVQTPLRVPPGVEVALGDPVFFRHAKSGELAEHVREFLLVRGDTVVDRALTYRGLGHAFLG